MSEEKKEHGESCCGTPGEKAASGGCCGHCGCGWKKLLCGLIIGAFIFASGMWYAKSHCQQGCMMKGGSMGLGKICPMGGNMGGGSMMGAK